MRGAQLGQVAEVLAGGIIPADAGSTAQMPYMQEPTQGSSPRMRGAPIGHMRFAAWVGIIPADAGSTSGPRAGTASILDHPRGCGEHLANIRTDMRFQGSSPRMRGARPYLVQA